ncbi:MFS transporter [Nocardia jejuensis]|uniref:MFS transporter n=1 Tax=Nocardia jejuensis TaxID=328049 RepID=UPI000A02E845|nr:MFS transporter [Nocardia jejuensis]
MTQSLTNASPVAAPTLATAAPAPISPASIPPHTAPPSRRSLAILAVILLGQFMAVLDASIVNVAIPAIRIDLHASGSNLQLIVSGYVIAYAVLLVTGARLGDRFGQRTLFVTGLAVFTMASLACGLAWNAPVLIAFRFLQGIGSAAMVPQVMTLIQRQFTGTTRARALSAYAAVISGGMVIGQIVGGLIVSSDIAGTSWRGVFLVNVPIGLALLAIAPRILPAPGVRGDRALDLAGLAVLTPAVLLLVVPLVLGHEQHWPAWTWIALACAALGFVGFALVERWVHRRGGEPLFADRVLQAPGLVLTAATLFLVMSTFSGWLFVMAIHLQGALGYSPLHAGLLFLPNGATFALASLNWQRIPARFHAVMIPAGLVLAAITMAIMGLLLHDGSPMGPLELAVFAIMGIGFGLSFSPLMARTTAKIPPALAADASGILVTNVQLGVVVGIATFGSVFLTLAGATALSSAHAVAITAIAEGTVVLAASVLAARAAR